MAGNRSVVQLLFVWEKNFFYLDRISLAAPLIIFFAADDSALVTMLKSLVVLD